MYGDILPSKWRRLGDRYRQQLAEHESGRFVNEDPSRDGANWYAYAANNPVGNVDFTGKAVWSWAALISVLVTMVAIPLMIYYMVPTAIILVTGVLMVLWDIGCAIAAINEARNPNGQFKPIYKRRDDIQKAIDEGYNTFDWEKQHGSTIDRMLAWDGELVLALLSMDIDS